MDNVSVHKVDGVEEIIEARGAIPFYLPAYSPDFNPIEQLFSKLLKIKLVEVACVELQVFAVELEAAPLRKVSAGAANGLPFAQPGQRPRGF